MPQLLVVQTNPCGDHSISRHLTRRFVAKWRAAHPDWRVVVHDLTKTDQSFVNAPRLQAYFTPPEQHSANMKDVLRLSDELVSELLAANHLVIATPVYNYNVSAALKAWVDHIVRKGLTLGMDGKGLVAGERATVLLASGGRLHRRLANPGERHCQPVSAPDPERHRHHRRDLHCSRRSESRGSGGDRERGFLGFDLGWRCAVR